MKYVYDFKEGNMSMKSLLGGKGANLAEMTNIGLPVPQGFTITTSACLKYYDEGKKLWDDLLKEIDEHLAHVEKSQGKKFSDANDPLLFSVRSGAVISMPGMMDTILNLGLNDETVKGLAKTTNNERFAYDSYRRFIQMFSDVAIGIPKAYFDAKLDDMKEKKGVTLDTGLDAEDLKKLVEEFKQVYKEEMREEFPQDPKVQLYKAVEAVFSSWNNNRAIVYRNLNGISHDLGVVKHMCDYIYIMHRGRFTETGNREDIYKNAKHIYTKRLIASIPQISPESRENIKENDLVFFDTRAAYNLAKKNNITSVDSLSDVIINESEKNVKVLYPTEPTHVGIYIGDGKIIHASSSKKQTVIDTLDNGYFKERIVDIRRYK